MAVNPAYRYSIMEALAKEDFRPKRYKELWDAVSDEIRSERTLALYLRDLEREGLVARRRISHKNVSYEIPSRHRDQWEFLSEPDPFGKHFGGFLRNVMSFVLESVGDKKCALDIALRYAFASFFRTRARFAPERIITADHQNRPVVIEKESRWYQLFLKFIESFLEKNEEAAMNWVKATSGDELIRRFAPRKITVSTEYPMQNRVNSEFELLHSVVEETDPELAKALNISEAARRIGLKLDKEFREVISRVEPSDDLYAVISLRDNIEHEVLPLVGPNRKLTPSELRSLYRKATGKVLTAGALAQVLEAIPHGSPLWNALKLPRHKTVAGAGRMKRTKRLPAY